MPTRAWPMRAVIIALALALLLPAQPAAACTCAQPQAAPEALARADAVFQGSVLTIVDRGQVLGWVDRLRAIFRAPGSYRMYGYAVTLDVAASWKGVTQTPVTLTTGYGGGDCGYAFAIGRDYLVYADEYAGELGTHICSRTEEVAYAAADLAYLNTQPALAVSPAVPWGAVALVCVPAALALLGVVGGLLMVRRVRARRPAA